MIGKGAVAVANAWLNKPCARCGGRKGEKYHEQKYCGNCVHIIAKEQSANAHARALEARYGITRTDYWDLYEFQGGVCYICRRANGRTRRLTVDHDHATGKVRGLLCRPCNNILGMYRDDPDAFRRAIAYLTDPPFSLMLESKRSTSNGARDGGDGRDPAEGRRGDECS